MSTGVGRIPWSEVTDVSVRQVLSHTMLAVDVPGSEGSSTAGRAGSR